MIIVPVDGSKHSHHALDYAVHSASKLGESLLLLNVQPKKEFSLPSENVSMDNMLGEIHKLGEKQLKEAVYQVDGKIEFETKIRVGVPSIEITSEAKEQRATAIIMGSRGNGPVVSAILGSVSYGVLHLSPCPVTVVPDRETGK